MAYGMAKDAVHWGDGHAAVSGSDEVGFCWGGDCIRKEVRSPSFLVNHQFFRHLGTNVQSRTSSTPEIAARISEGHNKARPLKRAVIES
jgi:hypothetical protein